MKENETRLGSHLVDLSDLLGQGAFGIVYAGRDATSGTPVAVKKLAIKQEEDGSQALEEIKKYLRIPPHANLVTLLDYHFKDNAFWLVLEYCTDGNMDEYVCRYVGRSHVPLSVFTYILTLFITSCVIDVYAGSTLAVPRMRIWLCFVRGMSGVSTG